ncbi:MAG TPA: patatin [Cyanobacteria bacterium UBA8543]|nr:patatin [Cyanobacteria bacterium UBA8543]
MAYRILSLDGGGIRGVISAVILEEVERQIKKPLNEHFDLIAGTSTGSILAAAIASGLKSQDIIRLYQDKGPNIFPYQSLFSPQRLGLVLRYGFSAPKFSDEGLIKVLQAKFGTTTLSDIDNSPQLLIVAYDTIGREPIVFKSWRRDVDYCNVPLWEACVCSASAPAYFPAHLLKTSSRTYSMIDGGVGASNPSACAVAEAIRLGYPIKDISVLSIGTGNSASPIVLKDARAWGLSQWIWNGRLIDVLFDASSKIHHYVTLQVLSSLESQNELYPGYLRLQPTITNAQIDDASPENIAKLVREAQEYIAANQNLLKKFIRDNYS